MYSRRRRGGVSENLRLGGYNMAGRVARKRLHYVRAVYGEGTEPQEAFSTLIGAALNHLRPVASTEVTMATLGTVMVRHRQPQRHPVNLAIGAGTPAEAMSTLGIGVATEADTEEAQGPPRHRAFKLADAICRLVGNDLLVCVDGMRLNSVEAYLRELLAKADQPAAHAAFELRPVANLDKQRVLEREGVKELRAHSTMLAATREIERGETMQSGWKNFLEMLGALLSKEAASDQEREVLAQHWDKFNVTAIINAKGGSNAEPIVLKTLTKLGEEVLDDEPDNMDVALVTESGTTIRPHELVLGKFQTFRRTDGANDLRYLDVWAELERYEQELRRMGHWQT